MEELINTEIHRELVVVRIGEVNEEDELYERMRRLMRMEINGGKKILMRRLMRMEINGGKKILS